MFMGDVGSTFLGFSFAGLSLLANIGVGGGRLPIEFGLILFAPFLFDSLVTLARRVLRGERWYAAHRSHYYQRLVRCGLSHGQVTSLYAGLGVVAAGAALAGLYAAEPLRQLLALVAYVPMLAVVALVARLEQPNGRSNVFRSGESRAAKRETRVASPRSSRPPLKMTTICVLGLGYIGLPTGSMFALAGNDVIGVDPSPRVQAALHAGLTSLDEPELQTLVTAAINSGRLKVRTRPEPADAFIIAVPTPLDTATNTADLSYVKEAARAIAPLLRRGNLVVLESTVPPGTTRDVLAPLLAESGLRPGVDVYVAHCPERVLPGRILVELEQNDRLAGGLTPSCAEEAAELYRSFVKGAIMRTDATTAEMVKVMENTFRDVNVALANEFALVAERIGVDVWEAIRLANHHPRVNVLAPGPGVGGHCIAVDPWFLVSAAPGSGRVDSRRAWGQRRHARPRDRPSGGDGRPAGTHRDPGRDVQSRGRRHSRKSRAARGRAGRRAWLRGAPVRSARPTRHARPARRRSWRCRRRCATRRRSCCWWTIAPSTTSTSIWRRAW